LDAVAARCRYDAEMLWNEVLELRTFSYARVKGIVDLVTLVGEYIITLTSYAASSKQDIHKVMGNVMAQMDKFFESLLEVAARVSGADCGSLMLLDGDKGELAVRYAFGADRETRLAGRVRVGSGISGRAFEKEETLLLDEKTADAALTKHMLRPMLASSMVFPYKVRGTTIGVLNLAAYRSNPVRFNASTVNSVNKLLELASFAFQVPIS
jgi:transcriptional regulator with GAF, ATPase, and Fis domain